MRPIGDSDLLMLPPFALPAAPDKRSAERHHHWRLQYVICHFCQPNFLRIAASNMHHHILTEFQMVAQDLYTPAGEWVSKYRLAKQGPVVSPMHSLRKASLRILLPTEQRCVAYADTVVAVGRPHCTSFGCRALQHALVGWKQANAQGACTG